jgi:hypothetical protein
MYTIICHWTTQYFCITRVPLANHAPFVRHPSIYIACLVHQVAAATIRRSLSARGSHAEEKVASTGMTHQRLYGVELSQKYIKETIKGGQI